MRNISYKKSQTEAVKTSLEATSEYPPLNFNDDLDIPFKMISEAYIFELNKEWKKLSKENLIKKIEAKSSRELNQIGITFAKKKKYQKAEEVFQKAVKKDKNYALAYYNLIHLYGILNNKKKALNLYEKFFKLFRRDEKMEELMRRYGFIEKEKDVNIIRSF